MNTIPVPLLKPDWPASKNIGAVVSTRIGGVSARPWDSLNLAVHVGDDLVAVATNRERFIGAAGRCVTPVWLQQVHGTRVLEITGRERDDLEPENQADAAFTRQHGLGCVIMTADCLPVLFCDRQGSVVGAAHAGWRGMADGVLRNTAAAMSAAIRAPASELLAWLGPAIGPGHFEVGEEVLARCELHAIDSVHRRVILSAFARNPQRPGYYFADIYTLARAELETLGLGYVGGGGFCTFRDQGRFYSYRRDGETGRMASMIWLRT